MIIGTKVEFENLADYILRDYLGSEYESYKPFDVNAFAKDYLKLEISYCEFNPKDNIEGKRIGNQIQLDQRLNEPTRIGERNFTVAHECGHDLINWQDPNYVPDQTINYRIRSQRKELKTENDFREWQAIGGIVSFAPPLSRRLDDVHLCEEGKDHCVWWIHDPSYRQIYYSYDGTVSWRFARMPPL